MQMADTKYIELKCKVSPLIPGRDILVAMLAEEGFESFVETEEGIQAFIPEPDFEKEKVMSIFDEAPEGIHWEAEEIEHAIENYNAQWESNFEQVKVGHGLLIRAPFHESDDSFDHQIIISPKMAFGTGHHETTWLIAYDMLQFDFTKKKVLDMGCGTGVLALLAMKLGAAEAVAIDIDPWSTENTEENISLNGLSGIEVRLGDASAIGNDQFDCILANINRNILTNDMSIYSKALKPGGSIWFSGFFKPDAEIIRDSAESNHLQFEFKDTRGDWAMIRAVKTA